MKNNLIFLSISLLFLPALAFPWPIPDSGQTKCYDDEKEIPCPAPGEPFYGQDGNFIINPRSYTKLDGSGNELPESATSWVMVRDNVTGLIWETKQNKDTIEDYSNPHDADNVYSWYNSDPSTNGGKEGFPRDGTDTEDFINDLNNARFGSHNNWRLPTIMELASLIDLSIPPPGPSIDSIYFPETLSANYWSSTTYAYDTTVAWCMFFYWPIDNLYVKNYFTYGGNYVRAVHDGKMRPTDSLIINKDGTVTDSYTGLMWQQRESVPMTWKNALSYCAALGFAGYEDWRLPQVNELRSIIDYNSFEPAIAKNYFPDATSSYYWSSTSLHTTGSTNSNCAWSVGLHLGYIYDYQNKSYAQYVRPVRGGQSFLPEHLYIRSPRQASFWGIADYMPITWDTHNITGNVIIFLSRDGGKTFPEIIASNIPNNGSHVWTVTGPVSVNCALKVEPISDPSKGTIQSLFTIKSSRSYTGRIPDSGQSKCHDGNGAEINCAGTGQDGEYIINPRSYTKLDAKGDDLQVTATSWAMVRDNVTGLIWEAKQNKDNAQNYNNPHDADNIYSWYDSNPSTNGGDAGTSGDGTDTEDFLSSLNSENLGGYTDWRLPAVSELSSLIDPTIPAPYSNPKISDRYFPETHATMYWSSSTDVSSTNTAWQVYFNTGYSISGDLTTKATHLNVRAVHGESLRSSNSFVINNDGTITDTNTGMMWQQGQSDVMSWNDALSYSSSLVLAGYDDWRLPEREQLQSIVDYSLAKPAINKSFFHDTPALPFWSSLSDLDIPENAWAIDFANGSNLDASKAYNMWRARSVRGGQPWISDHLYIQSPLQGSRWTTGYAMPVIWDTQNISGNVTVSLSRDGGKTFPEIIASDSPNDGSHTWTVTGPISYNCALKIHPLDDPSKETIQSLFTITTDTTGLIDTIATVGTDSDTTSDDVIDNKWSALIVAAGGPTDTAKNWYNNIWRETRLCANYAYMALSFQGFSDADIHYMSHAPEQLYLNGRWTDVVDDTMVTKTSFQNALKNFAPTGATPTDNLIIYLMDHGLNGRFTLGPNEYLRAGEFKEMLDGLNIPGQVIVVIESCYSGTFIPYLITGNQKRVVITSASAENALIKNGGQLSFSFQFWANVFSGFNLRDAFQRAAYMMTGIQIPNMDADGDGDANTKNDDLLALTLTIGDGTKTAPNLPIIDNVTIELTQPWDVAIKAQVADTVSQVWAVVIPPDRSAELPGDPAPLPEITLTDLNGDHWYEANYTLRQGCGLYRLNVYASTGQGDALVTSLPYQVSVQIDEFLVPADLNGNCLTELSDAIISLQVTAGMAPQVRSDIGAGVDVGGDDRIGLAEAVHALRRAAGL